jgi:hypothetical protein
VGKIYVMIVADSQDFPSYINSHHARYVVLFFNYEKCGDFHFQAICLNPVINE